MSESADEVRSLVRGLEILKALNKAGSARPGLLARRVGLARPTVYRLLETLEEGGFVAKSASDERYRITERTGRFFARYDAAQEIDQSACTAFDEAARRCPWLLHLSTCENDAMVVRLASRSAIPLMPWRGYVGERLPLAGSSAGKVYLAACHDAQRGQLLDISLLDYATSEDDSSAPPAISISIALQRDGYALGALTAVCVRSALNGQDATADLVSFLRTEAQAIAKQLSPATRVAVLRSD